MQLDELSPELLRRVLDAYLTEAYPTGTPAHVPIPEIPDDAGPAELLGLFLPEERPHPDGSSLTNHLLRLGNHSYPHMKVGLMEFVPGEEWVWSIDTHDRVAITPESPDWDRWRELRVENLRIKAAVEAAWRAAGLDTARIVAARMPQEDEGASGPLVLVVDDEEGMRSVAVNMLRGAGYRVEEASGGLEALELFVERRPDLVLMDYEMPGMDGRELCRRLRGLRGPGEAAIPMLMATAGSMDLSSVPGLDGFLVKPYQRTLLLSFVKHQLPWDKQGSDEA